MPTSTPRSAFAIVLEPMAHQWLTGDSYDNAMAESIIGLFKTEVINDLGPWKSMAQVEWETLHWVSWYNTERLHSAIGHRPPQDVQDEFHAEMNALENAA